MSRVQQLDGIRGVAIAMVLLWHYVPCQITPDPGTAASYLKVTLSLTWSGVDLFFVLSGFLIGGILLDHKLASNYFRVFYVRRVCRIFPLYFLLLGSFVVLTATPIAADSRFRWLFDNPFPLWSYATFTQNVQMGLRGDYGPHWLGITWSLAVEEQFYLFVPLLVWTFDRRSLAAVLAVLILGAPLLRVLVPSFFAFVNTPFRADSLLLGTLLSLLARWDPFCSAVRRSPRMALAAFCTLLAGAAVMTIRPGGFGALNHTWLAALYAAFILIGFAHRDSGIGRSLSAAPLVWLGQRSYGIYMFHQAASGLLHGFVRGSPPAIHCVHDAAVTLASLGLTLAAAEVSYRFIEAPILSLGHKTKYLSA